MFCCIDTITKPEAFSQDAVPNEKDILSGVFSLVNIAV